VLLTIGYNDNCVGDLSTGANDESLMTNIIDVVDFGTSKVTNTIPINPPILLHRGDPDVPIVNVSTGPFAGAAYLLTVPLNATKEVHSSISHGVDTNSVCNPGGDVGGIGSAQLTVIRPAITVTKRCLTAVNPNGSAAGVVVTYSGTVSNSGDAPLTSIVVVNNQPAPNTTVFTAATLAVGASVTFTNSYTNTATVCGPFTDTLTSTAVDAIQCPVTSSSTDTCTITYAPCISVTKNCDTVVIGSPNTVSGVVSNCGNITLTNISISDNIYGSVATFASLAPGASQSYSKVVTNTCGSFPNTVTATARDICGTQVSATASATCVVTENPCIRVTKTCDTVVVGQANLVTAVVTNCGNVPLHGITVTDNIYGSVGTIASLAVGGTATLTKSVTNTCGNFPNTVTAIGLSPCNTSVTNTSTATCVVTENPCIAVTKTCDTVKIGQANTVTAVVTNCGNVPLHGITVTDNIYGSVGTIASLAVGGTATLTKSVTNTCGSFPNTVTATGLSPCNTSVTNTSTATCSVICQPEIKVYKQVVCYAPTGCEQFSSDLTAQHSALGVRTDNPLNCPAFCYRITVTNSGSVTLSNLVITDLSVPGPNLNLSGCSFPTTLPIGGSASCVIPIVERCSNDVNVVTATAVGEISSGGAVTTTNVFSKDTNTVTVVPISIVCGIYIRTNGGTDFIKYSSCPSQPLGATYTVRIGITNNGQYALQNVILANLAGFAGCFASPTNLGSLAIGAVAIVDCQSTCTSVSSNFYSVSVRGEASTAGGHVCIYNSQGLPITTQSQCEACVLCIGQAAIKVYKQVVCYTNVCEPFNSDLTTQKTATGVRTDNPLNCPAFCYRITVTNAGSVPLSNVVITDNSVPGPNLNLASCSFPTTLAVGATAQCVLPAVTRCSNDVNVVTASGVGEIATGVTTNVSSMDTNTVVVKPISIECQLTVSTNGPGGPFYVYSSICATQTVGSNYVIRIRVTNTGQYDLQNVIVTDLLGTFSGCFSSPMSLGNLSMNQTKTNDCTFVCNSPVGIPTNYRIGVSGEASQAAGHICTYNAQGIPITATNDCNTCVVCEGVPCIKVFKGIACVICTTNGNGGVELACASATGGFNKEAYGVRSDTQDPAFCYQIMVTNCGTLSLNVTITDAKLGLINVPIGILAPNQAFTTNLVQDWHVTTTNVVIANGIASGTGASVSDTNFAIAHVRPASIACVKTVSINGGPFQHSIRVTNEIVTNISWAVTITNTGQADLESVTITDLSQNDDLPCNVNMVLPGIFPVGGSVGPIIVCSNNTGFTSCTNLSLDNDIRIVANAAAEGTNCVWDINGQNIMVQTSCDAHLDLFCIVPNACRVTGGGRQDDPNVCPADVRYVTHGGQVGAPVGNKVCTIDTTLPNYWLGNPCIHGRWTHVRHVKGGLEGNFHARFYDTLDCACLDVAFNQQTCQYGPLTVEHGICGDRSTGPLPRPAGANKIAFTGVGDWACANGRREGRACLFRVDIEDRGEPGNAHALASNGKENRVPDRYRIRIWVLSDEELAQLNGAGPDQYLLNFRNAISACNGLSYRDGGILGQCNADNTCISNDSCTRGGPATPTIMFPGGAPVRLPNIDDGGEMLHGNHQIHPAIKNCDPFNPTGPGLAKP